MAHQEKGVQREPESTPFRHGARVPVIPVGMGPSETGGDILVLLSPPARDVYYVAISRARLEAGVHQIRHVRGIRRILRELRGLASTPFRQGVSVAVHRRAALYHRVSTLDQDPTLARAELRAAAKRLGFRVVLDVEEKGSGARNDRPGFQRVLGAARQGEFDALLVFKLDRAGRSALDLLANIRELVDVHGVRFVVTSQGLDLKRTRPVNHVRAVEPDLP